MSDDQTRPSVSVDDLKRVESTPKSEVRILSASVGPEVQAVLGAKRSRASDIEKRWAEFVAISTKKGDADTAVKDFFDTNIKGYSHASIADMCPVWADLNGVGPMAAWMLLDFDMFSGQEVSSRVIDQGATAERRAVCSTAPDHPRLHELHEKWLNFYDGLTASNAGAEAKAYKFDDKRFALPGTMRSGVTFGNVRARDYMRHAQNLKLFGGMGAQLGQQMIDAAAAYIPSMTDGLTMHLNEHGEEVERQGQYVKNWHDVGTAWVSGEWRMQAALIGCETGVKLNFAEDFLCAPEQVRHLFWLGALADRGPGRTKHRAYFTESYKHLPRFQLTQVLSLGTARDEHRHRRAMPWDFKVVVDENRQPLFCPWAPFKRPDALWKETCEVFNELRDADPTAQGFWSALHALPFCATVVLSSTLDLPALVYKAELRATAPNAHWEYKRQNLEVLRRLVELLPRQFVEANHLHAVVEGNKSGVNLV